MFNFENHDEFWAKIKSIKQENIFIFKHVSTFALNILCFPNANATPERVWSKYNLEKTPIRNRLNFESMRGILLAAQFVKDEGGCLLFEPDDEMIENYKNLKMEKKKN